MTELNQNSGILTELKSAVLNVDWEISDETLAELSKAVEALQAAWAGEKVLLVYLQILGALCQYIGTSREKSHPGTFSLVKDVFNGLEGVVTQPEMDQATKNKDVMGYADRYNTLKSEIASGDFVPGPPQDDTPKSTMDTLMEDEEDHSTDTVFDSMLNAMVQAPEDEQEDTEPAVEIEMEEDEPEEPPKPAPVPSRPPVQAAFNKADGTEVEPDRNEDDEFAEADELLDDFFADDDVPVPGAENLADDDGIFDLDELSGEDDGEDVLDLSVDGEESSVDDTDDAELVIELDDATEDVAEDDSFQEMEETLDDFFGEDEEEDLLEPATDEDESLIDEALGDFFEDGEEEPPEESNLEVATAEVSDVDETDLALTESEEVDRGEDEEAGESLDIDLDEPEIEDAAPSLAIAVDEVATESVACEEEPEETHSEPDAGWVENLQMLLLSVEWEVDDRLLLRLQEEVETLTTLLKDNQPACIHLDFLRTVIHYVGRDSADVISDSMACLKLIADSLEGLLQNESESSTYTAGAVRSFVDWHELVVLDFEKNLAESREKSVAEAVETTSVVEPSAGAVRLPLSAEMEEVRESILKEVRELIVKELAESK